MPAKERKLADRTIKDRITSAASLSMTSWGIRRAADVAARRGQGGRAHPSIMVNFRSSSSSFSRGNTMNFMAAIEPAFKSGYVEPLPVGNADVGATAARLLGLTRMKESSPPRQRWKLPASSACGPKTACS
jgi:hypothetical protein